ncbi:MAG TPA: response regulator, partial [Gammaproteobacteria bacterium]
DKVWAERQGASGYLIKPAKEDELIAAINKLL